MKYFAFWAHFGQTGAIAQISDQYVDSRCRAFLGIVWSHNDDLGAVRSKRKNKDVVFIDNYDLDCVFDTLEEAVKSMIVQIFGEK